MYIIKTNQFYNLKIIKIQNIMNYTTGKKDKLIFIQDKSTHKTVFVYG